MAKNTIMNRAAASLSSKKDVTPLMDHNQYNLNEFDQAYDENDDLDACSVDSDWDEVPSNLDLRELGV